MDWNNGESDSEISRNPMIPVRSPAVRHGGTLRSCGETDKMLDRIRRNHLEQVPDSLSLTCSTMRSGGSRNTSSVLVLLHTAPQQRGEEKNGIRRATETTGEKLHLCFRFFLPSPSPNKKPPRPSALPKRCRTHELTFVILFLDLRPVRSSIRGILHSLHPRIDYASQPSNTFSCHPQHHAAPKAQIPEHAFPRQRLVPSVSGSGSECGTTEAATL